MPTKVAMFVMNNIQNDARVNREAETLASAGYDVRIFAFLSGPVAENETVHWKEHAYRVSRLDQRSWLDRRWSRWWPRRPQRRSADLQPVLQLELPGPRQPQREPGPPQRTLPEQATPEQRAHCRYIQRINRRWWHAAREWRPEICHAHDLDALWAAQSTALSCGSALVYDSHEIWDQQPFIPCQEIVTYWNQLEARLAPSVDGWVTVNRSLATLIGRRYASESEMVVLHNCPRLCTPDPQLRGTLRQKFEGRPVALFSGGFAAGRGLEQMVAAALLQKDVALVIQGFGPLAAPLRQLAEEHRSPVHFLEGVSRDQVVASCAAADIGVIPTLPDCLNSYYSTPNKLFDYVMAGLALVAGDIPEQRRFVTEWDNGLIYDAWSAADLAECLQKLAADELRARMAVASRRAAEQQYNWEKESLKLLELYRQMEERQRRGALRLKNWVDPEIHPLSRTAGARSKR